MDFRLLHFRCWLTAEAVLLAVLTAHAQSAGPSGGESIVFSAPGNESVSSNLMQLSPALPNLQAQFEDPFQKPAISFSANHQSAGTPASRPAVPVMSRNSSQRLPDLLDPQHNWSLMTPAQILGVKMPDSDATGSQADQGGQFSANPATGGNQDRQSRLAPAGAGPFSFNHPSASTASWANPNWNSEPGSDENSPNSINHSAQAGADWFLNQFLNATPNRGGTVNPNAGAGQFNAFGTPVQSQPDSEEKSDLDSFHKLFYPNSLQPTDTGHASGSAFSSPFSQKSSQLDVRLGLPASNPNGGNPDTSDTGLGIGSPFVPLTSLIGAPVGTPKLPTATAQPAPKPVSRPAWAPKPPPWLSTTPNPFAPPQRKF